MTCYSRAGSWSTRYPLFFFFRLPIAYLANSALAYFVSRLVVSFSCLAALTVNCWPICYNVVLLKLMCRAAHAKCSNFVGFQGDVRLTDFAQIGTACSQLVNLDVCQFLSQPVSVCWSYSVPIEYHHFQQIFTLTRTTRE